MTTRDTKGHVHNMRGKDARALPPQSSAFSGQMSDNRALESNGTAWQQGTINGALAYQSLVEEINSFYRGLGKQRGKWAPLADGQ